MKHELGAYYSAKAAFSNLREGTTRHGISDGTWSWIQGIKEINRQIGPMDVFLATWSAGRKDLLTLRRMLDRKQIKSLKLCLDYSYEGLNPHLCRLARKLFGDDALRIWRVHAKFCVFSGGPLDILYLTSANLNQNWRIENYTVVCGGSLPSEYLEMILDVHKWQKPGICFGGRQQKSLFHTDKVFRKRARRTKAARRAAGEI